VTPDTNRKAAMNSPTHRWMKVIRGRKLGGANRTRPDRAGAGSAAGAGEARSWARASMSVLRS
jgi:hypothetical protein